VHTQPISCFSRYVDDIFFLTSSKEEADSVLIAFQNLHPSINFTIEHPDQHNALNLLDICVQGHPETGNFSFSFYRKSVKSDHILHASSHVPSLCKTSTLNHQLSRIAERCSSDVSFQAASDAFSKQLTSNGYPESFISSLRLPCTKSRFPRQSPSPRFYLSFPFLGDAVDFGLKKLFTKHGLNVGLAHKSNSLQRVLHNPIPVKERTCSLKDCPLKASKLCFRKMVVYHIKCSNCLSAYVGSTSRFLHLRLREHLHRKESSVFQHKIVCKGSFITTVLRTAKDEVDLRLLESSFIHSVKPCLNHKEDLFAPFLFSLFSFNLNFLI